MVSKSIGIFVPVFINVHYIYIYVSVYIYFVSFLLWLSRFLCIDCRTSPTNSSGCYTDILPCGYSLWWILEHQDSGSGSVFYYHSELDVFIDFGHFICFAYSWIFEDLSFCLRDLNSHLVIVRIILNPSGSWPFLLPIWSLEADPLLSQFFLLGFLSIRLGPCGLISGHGLSEDMAQYCGMFIASVDCQLKEIWNHLGDKPSCIPIRGYLD